jgi:hypothetical protein
MSNELPKLLDYTVFFTHFVQVYKYTPTKKRLLEMFQRGAAVITETQQRAIDLIIPIYCPADKEGACLSEDNMSFILVSVKNRKENKDHISWMKAIQPHQIGIVPKKQDITLPFVSLLINLGCETSGAVFYSPVVRTREQPARAAKGDMVEEQGLSPNGSRMPLPLEIANHQLALVGLQSPDDPAADITGRVYNPELYDSRIYTVLKNILKLNNSLADLVAYNNPAVSVTDLEALFSTLDPLAYQ